MIIKQTTLILTFLLTTLLCFGQNKEWNYDQHQRDRDRIFLPLLYSEFSEKPYARYTVVTSFTAEYAFSVEKIDEKYYIISNIFSENLWYAGFKKSRDSVKLITRKTEISKKFYLKIGELFAIASQIRENEDNMIGVSDGVTYYFEITDKDERIKTGKFRVFTDYSLLEKLVKICDSLFSIEIENDTFLKEIDILIYDLKKDKFSRKLYYYNE